jgi:hypothetical protein
MVVEVLQYLGFQHLMELLVLLLVVILLEVVLELGHQVVEEEELVALVVAVREVGPREPQEQ